MSGYLIDGLVGGTVLAVVVATIAALPAVRRRPALVFWLWLVVVVRFLVPGLYAIELPVDALATASAQVSATSPAAVTGATSAAPDGFAAWQLLLGLWLVGVVLVGGATVRSWWRLRSRIAGLAPAPRSIADRADALARDLGLGRTPAIAIGDGGQASGPFAAGVLAPVVVLPAWLCDGADIDSVLAHELTHLRRRDPLFALVARAAEIVFFFWPIVWLATRRLAAAREAACDRAAVRALGLEPRGYARTLVRVTLAARGAPIGSAAMAAHAGQLRDRIDNLVGGRRTAGFGKLGVMLVVAEIALALPAARFAAAAVDSSALECTVAPGVEARILASNPDADRDGDGALSRDEICAHQQRMQRRLIDAAIRPESLADLDPDADRDGDGALSPAEVRAYREQVGFSWAEPAKPALVRDGEVLVAAAALQVDVEIADAGTAVCTAAPDRCVEGGPLDRQLPSSLVLVDVTSD